MKASFEPMRDQIIAGNWKMHCNRADARNLLGSLLELLRFPTTAEVVICPPYTSLATAADIVTGTPVVLGAQDVFWKPSGAYTGQISTQMLVEIGCRYVIVGHSERRGRFGVPAPEFDATILSHFGDNDVTVNLKLRAVLEAGLIPICCVGETLAERHAGSTDQVVAEQTTAALTGVAPENAQKVVFAYEPVWAIGTGEVCASAEADRVCGVIRSTIGALLDPRAAETVRIQYGGSVRADNAADLLSRPNIDGALVGGASLKAGEFAAIVTSSPKPQRSSSEHPA